MTKASRTLAKEPLKIIMPDESMFPRIFQNDILSIDTANIRIPKTGGIYAIRSDDGVKIRRLYRKARSIMIMADNPKIQSLSKLKGEAIIGRVIHLSGANNL